jgi:hypothetical protein
VSTDDAGRTELARGRTESTTCATADVASICCDGQDPHSGKGASQLCDSDRAPATDGRPSLCARRNSSNSTLRRNALTQELQGVSSVAQLALMYSVALSVQPPAAPMHLDKSPVSTFRCFRGAARRRQPKIVWRISAASGGRLCSHRPCGESGKGSDLACVDQSLSSGARVTEF